MVMAMMMAVVRHGVGGQSGSCKNNEGEDGKHDVSSSHMYDPYSDSPNAEAFALAVRASYFRSYCEVNHFANEKFLSMNLGGYAPVSANLN